MNPAQFVALQHAVSRISRLRDTRDRVKAYMAEAQQMFNSLRAVTNNKEKLAWALKQQKFWTKAYWKASNNYLNALKEGGE